MEGRKKGRKEGREGNHVSAAIIWASWIVMIVQFFYDITG